MAEEQLLMTDGDAAVAEVATQQVGAGTGARAQSADNSASTHHHHDDSGHESGEHESNDSSPESPSTPQSREERSTTPAEVTAAGASTMEVSKKGDGGGKVDVLDDEDGADSSIYRIKIVTPNGESVDVQIGESDMVQELYQMLLERDSTCHRTCFRICYEGKPLDHFTEIHNIPNIKNSAVFTIAEEPYNVREARVHVRHLRELLRCLDKGDAYTGVDCQSLTCLPSLTSPSTGSAHDVENLHKRRPLNGGGTTSSSSSGAGQMGASDDNFLPNSYLLPEAGEELPLQQLIPVQLLNDPKQHLLALKSISFSPYSPPGPRKLLGDLLYLVVETVEERRFHVTCGTRGFFVNSTTRAPSDGGAADSDAFSGERFNPEPSRHVSRAGRGGQVIFHSLFELLSELSAHFRKTLPQILKARNEKQIHERLPTPYQTYGWLVPPAAADPSQMLPDQIRTDDLTQPHRIGLEDHVPGQARDWNEELQTTHSMPRTNLHERLCRDRAKFKVHADFLAASMRGATQVVEGSLLTMNPMDDPNTHMYIWNNIFLSYGFDVKDHYKEVGGDAAAHAATSLDLAAVRAYSMLDHPKLHTLGMAIVDYRGYRITAQSIIPGILEREQEETVVYGSFDSGKTVLSSPAYVEMLADSAKQLKIAPHRVWNGKEEGSEEYVQLYSSFESKGIVGNDSRHYLLDLLKTFPPDVNFLEGAEVSDEARANGFPRRFKHKLVTLRQELVDAFVNSRYLTFMRIASALIQKHQIEAKESKNESSPPPPNGPEIATGQADTTVEAAGTEVSAESDAKTVEELSSQVIAETNRLMGGNALKGDGESSELDIRFNPDCYSTAVKHAPEEDLPAQKKLLAEAADHLLTQQIPNFTKDASHQNVMPIDGRSLVEAMHTHGINLRYLGKVIEATKGIARLDYVPTIARVELLCRSVRHVYRPYVRAVQPHLISSAISHFLNCFIGCDGGPASVELPAGSSSSGDGHHSSTQAQVSAAGAAKKAHNRKKRRAPQQSATTELYSLGSELSPEWCKLTQKELWKSIADDAQEHYGVRLEGTDQGCDGFITECTGGSASRHAILRRFCQMVGIQLLLKNYQLSGVRAPFADTDIFNVVPVMKHLNPRAHDAYELYLTALAKFQQGYPRIGYEIMSQAQQMQANVYGVLHSDLALCHRAMARMAYAMGEPVDALQQQQRALMVSERCSGLDHYETIVDYINTAHFSFANLYVATSLRLFYRARYLLLTVHGEDHPLMGQIDANIGVILFFVREFDLALKFLHSARAIYSKYDVSLSLKSALVCHVLARTHSCRGDFRTALSMEKETFGVYVRIFGLEHEKTRLSGECLRHLTKQAVNFQKRVNDASKLLPGTGSQSLAHLIPMNIQPPSVANIVEILNSFNSLVFVRIKTAPQSNEADGEDAADAKERKDSGDLKTAEESHVEAMKPDLVEESLD